MPAGPEAGSGAVCFAPHGVWFVGLALGSSFALAPIRLPFTIFHSFINTLTDGKDSIPCNGAAQPSDAPSQSHAAEEWGEFGHLDGKRFYDFSDIRREIERQTARLCGSGKGISSSPISLTIHSPKLLNLTLVDLPGMTKVAVQDQPQGIEQELRQLVFQFIDNPNSIIVAVSPANSDLANSDALQVAREVDPGGNRTLGVLTKLDLMDKGTDALAVLMGNVLKLKLGFVGVVNRSQADINDAKSIAEALKSEDEYFRRHPVYNPIAVRCGTAYLTKRLNSLLLKHIHRALPEVRERISTALHGTEAVSWELENSFRFTVFISSILFSLVVGCDQRNWKVMAVPCSNLPKTWVPSCCTW